MLRLKDKIIELIRPELDSMGFELVDIDFAGVGKKSILRLYIDSKEEGTNRCKISIADCEKVSHAIQRLLEVEELVKGDYTLEVSTPGLERTLTKLADYKRFVGRLCKVVLKKEGCFVGRISRVDGKDVVFESDGDESTVNIEEIKKANLKFER